MSLFSCSGCAAKDAEIARLTAAMRETIARLDRYEFDLISLLRERAGWDGLATSPPPAIATMPPRLDPTVEVFLDAKFVYATPLWRQQHREAEKLLADGVDAERVMEVLARGQQIEV